MFIRIKTSKNTPRSSVQICESYRENGKVRQKILRHVGVAQNDTHLQELKILAQYLMDQFKKEREGPSLPGLTPRSSLEKTGSEHTQEPITPKLPVDLADVKEEKRIVDGFHDIFGKLFRELGFHKFLSKRPTKTLLDILIARITQPASKRSSQEFLDVEFDRKTPLDSIYRMMDQLLPHADQIQKDIAHATCSLFKEQVNIILFDVTTLYFESIEQDELRDFGYSKDQKFHMTQVVLALATNIEGFPLGYKLFPGNTAEVTTLLQCLDTWKQTLPVGDILFVADRAMMSEKNLQALEEVGIKYVIAAKLKKCPTDIQERILGNDGTWIELQKEKHCKQEIAVSETRRLIVTYNEKRARKDRKDREKMIEKMRKRLSQSKNPKKLVTNRGYAKFIHAEGNITLTIDEKKLAEEAAWDGFHGIITNDISSQAAELLLRYRRLWVIEECFRIQKHTLSVRPVFHWKPWRVQAHVLLCYMAFTLVRHAEWRIQVQQKGVSILDLRRELQRVQTSILRDTRTGKRYYMPSRITNKAKKIYQAMGVIRNGSAREIM